VKFNSQHVAIRTLLIKMKRRSREIWRQHDVTHANSAENKFYDLMKNLYLPGEANSTA